jgi:hypothetical protein
MSRTRNIFSTKADFKGSPGNILLSYIFRYLSHTFWCGLRYRSYGWQSLIGWSCMTNHEGFSTLLGMVSLLSQHIRRWGTAQQPHSECSYHMVIEPRTAPRGICHSATCVCEYWSHVWLRCSSLQTRYVFKPTPWPLMNCPSLLFVRYDITIPWPVYCAESITVNLSSLELACTRCPGGCFCGWETLVMSVDNNRQQCKDVSCNIRSWVDQSGVT